MRKIFSTLLAVSILLATTAASAEYQKYLDGDRNYVLFDGYQYDARYVVRNSLNVEKYAPPIYIISFDWVYVSNAYRGSTKIGKRYAARFAYDWNEKKIYSVDENGEWHYLDPQGSRASGVAMAAAAEIAFYLAYNMKFHGIYSDDFYPD